MAQITVGEATGRAAAAAAPDQPLREVLDRFAAERTNALPVIDADGTLLGVVSAGDVERAIAHGADGPAARARPRSARTARRPNARRRDLALPRPTTRAYRSSTPTASASSAGSHTDGCSAPTTHASTPTTNTGFPPLAE